MLFLLAACASAHSAEPLPTPVAPISSGDRLRVTHTSQCCTNPAIGIEYSLDRDSLVIQPEVGTQRFALPRSTITHIERWNAGQRHLASGSLWGALAGAAVGGLIGYQSGCGHCDGDMRPLGAISGAIVGGAVGLLAGLIVGAQQHSFWETVPQN
jgi:hypothetical protein